MKNPNNCPECIEYPVPQGSCPHCWGRVPHALRHRVMAWEKAIYNARAGYDAAHAEAVKWINDHVSWGAVDGR